LNKEANFKANGADRYGRTSGIIFIESQDINLLSIKGCYSWHFKRYSSDQQYEDAEAYARENNPGLLRLPNPVPPCEWRKGN
jgi:endonuclease YncB( thermonuclease family)